MFLHPSVPKVLFSQIFLLGYCFKKKKDALIFVILISKYKFVNGGALTQLFSGLGLCYIDYVSSVEEFACCRRYRHEKFIDFPMCIHIRYARLVKSESSNSRFSCLNSVGGVKTFLI